MDGVANSVEVISNRFVSLMFNVCKVFFGVAEIQILFFLFYFLYIYRIFKESVFTAALY